MLGLGHPAGGPSDSDKTQPNPAGVMGGTTLTQGRVASRWPDIDPGNNKYWISCYSGDLMLQCVCVHTRVGKVQHRPWASVCLCVCVLCLTLSVHSAVYSICFPETKVSKIPQQGDRGVNP